MRRTSIPALLSAVAIAATFQPSAARAEEPATIQDLEGLSLSDLLDIKLQTGSFLELDLARSPVSMTIIDREKIRMAGANNLSELLEIYVPGFQYMYNKWNGVLWGMRGVTNDRNSKFIVLVDGHKLNTESRDGFFQETAMGLFGEVERIEVLRGPAGLVYGSGAIAGVVNIVTRDPGRSGAEVEVKGRTWTTGFGNTAKSVQGNVFGAMDDAQSFRASMGWEQSDGVGSHVSRIYGQATWPSAGIPQPDGSPVNGSALSTPGNWKADADWRWKDLRVYGRFTHQVQEASGWFAEQPWPNLLDSVGKYNGLHNSYASLSQKIGSGQGTSTDSASLPVLAAKLDALAAYLESAAPSVEINGRSVSPTDPYWSSTATGGTNPRREYIADGISLESDWSVSWGDDQLKLRAAFDGVTNKIGVQQLPGYDNSTSQVQTIEDFGEKRYTLGALYLLKSIPKLQLALGAEQRFDDLGDGLDGNNMENEVSTHATVTPVWYSNTAVFSEGYYDVGDALSVDAGIRWDGHTRTIDQGGTLNGKLATIWMPAKGHSIKLIFQSSSNNGSVDNYEPNRFQMDDAGTVYPNAHFQSPNLPGNANNQVIPGVTTAELHKLKPEKNYSFELTSTDDLGNGFSLAPSLSYSIVEDMFIWNQPLLRVVNCGGYSFLNFDLEGAYKAKTFEIGANHTAQYVVNTDVDAQALYVTMPYEKNDPGVYDSATKTYLPTPGKTSVDTLNPIRDAITADGRHFLSLASNVTKFFVNWRPFPSLALHSDVRVFWALDGRDSTFGAKEKEGYDFLNISRDPSIKWNASIHVELPDNWSVGLYAYDILGINDAKNGGPGTFATNTLRWQQSYDPNANDVYAQDLQSFALELRRSF
jgi:outer membrane receptor protein involved in Fe transport